MVQRCVRGGGHRTLQGLQYSQLSAHSPFQDYCAWPVREVGRVLRGFRRTCPRLLASCDDYSKVMGCSGDAALAQFNALDTDSVGRVSCYEIAGLLLVICKGTVREKIEGAVARSAVACSTVVRCAV